MTRRFATLDEWLAWQEHLHPREIELGLERAAGVFRALGWGVPPFAVVTVGGTNGKGSCVAMLESCLLAAGYRTASYTSPHLLRYNERVRLNGVEAHSEVLCEAFARVEAARGSTSLTYFEFGTLAALDIFYRAQPDVMILEVGLGGRLDATNIVDADVAVVTTVDIDHVSYLGSDREAIGGEKAGIFRTRHPAICGDPAPPASLTTHAAAIDAQLYCSGRDFGYAPAPGGWSWWSGTGVRRGGLPLPALEGSCQLQNAAVVLMALELLAPRLPLAQGEIRRGLVEARLPGRFQVLGGPVTQVLDVAHNPQAATALAETLRLRRRGGRLLAVVGMLADKDIPGTLKALVGIADAWHVADLAVARGAPGARLGEALDALGVTAPVRVYRTVKEARHGALLEARAGDHLVVFGSFYTVAAVLAEHL